MDGSARIAAVVGWDAMTLLMDLAAILVFPGLAFPLAAGVISIWALGWLVPRFAGQPAVRWGELLGGTRRLLELAFHPDAAELNWASATLLFAILAAAAAVSSLWATLFYPPFWVWGHLYVLMALLSVPPLVGIVWAGRLSEVGRAERKRDLLLALYLGALFLALTVPAVLGRSLWLGELARSAGGALPVVMTASGATAFVAAAGAATFYLALLDGVWDDCLAVVGGAVQALLVQLARALCWLAVISALVVPFWSLPGSTVIALSLNLLAYLVLLALLAGLRAVLLRLGSTAVIDVAWLPCVLLALVSLGLAIGGW
ncbi:MAG: hypothetical protein ACYC4L_01080 [Chloroflexota bacterium]